jgi:YVTN family beta-propeller protein
MPLMSISMASGISEDAVRIESAFSFSDTLARLQSTLESRGFRIFAVIAHRAAAESVMACGPPAMAAGSTVGLENDDALVAIDAAANEVVASVPIGQAPQAIAYVANAVPHGNGMQGLQPLGTAGQVSRIVLAPVADAKSAGVVHRTRQACPCSTKA